MRYLVGLAGLAITLTACATTAYGPATITVQTRPMPPAPPQPPIAQTNTDPEPEQVSGPDVDKTFQPALELRTCDGRPVSNAPARDADGYLKDYRPFITVSGEVNLALAPIRHACLSSGFGRRTRSTHKGIDLSTRRNGMKVNTDNLSAGPAIILEAEYHRDFGYYVVLAHGSNVFTRYAHMKRLYDGIEPGAHIGFATALGPMGSTGRATGAHLHYEVLVGNYDTPKKSFGLMALDPFAIAKMNAREESSDVMALDLTLR